MENESKNTEEVTNKENDDKDRLEDTKDVIVIEEDAEKKLEERNGDDKIHTIIEDETKEEPEEKEKDEVDHKTVAGKDDKEEEIKAQPRRSERLRMKAQGCCSTPKATTLL